MVNFSSPVAKASKDFALTPLISANCSSGKKSNSLRALNLPKSIEAFVQGKDMVNVLLKNGFNNAKYKTYTFGICSMYLGEK